jgi:hypothetical protein
MLWEFFAYSSSQCNGLKSTVCLDSRARRTDAVRFDAGLPMFGCCCGGWFSAILLPLTSSSCCLRAFVFSPAPRPEAQPALSREERDARPPARPPTRIIHSFIHGGHY